jgi:retron-type reverse transcriptase
MVSSIYPASANTQLTEMYVDKTSLHLFFIFMGNKYDNLIQKVVENDNLIKAYKQARKGKRLKNEVLLFKEHLQFNLQQIKNDILNKTYKIGNYREFKIYYPKERNISALPFRDRVVQHALCNVIEPLFDKAMFSMSYACRKGKGTHRCMLNTKRMLLSFNGPVYFLKMDFSKFFPSIDRSVLYREIYRKIKDPHVLWLLEQIIPSTGTGLPIGNLTSQLFANVFAGIFDRRV